ncbi:UDP-glucose 4-epimerase [Auriscalpium vulgare]|uniref:UDP-glucose 4-epimerase n=1 Tax=Auriscalpium vulgare TaxID=40419 RepID=A0ACB8R959_9AGAM|nr:UDP-glucose 4-epimerase [Auriscalpium vulgare]
MVFTSAANAIRSVIASPPLDSSQLGHLVVKTLEDTPSRLPQDVRRAQWELALKNEIFTLAAEEGAALEDPDTKYYDELKARLDLVLAFTEHEACEQTFPFTTLQDLLETQTIVSCSHIFSWIEAHAARLTENMVPQKGKALILLRTLNDLLRRLSKMGSNTIFCGRILTFLSGVFPLGERSGVNLRGEYGPTWEGAKEEAKVEEKPEEEPQEKMQVDEPSDAKTLDKKGERKDDFYNTFWSLQLPFSRPPAFATPNTFEEFKESVNKVMPVIKEATAKDRAMTGSRTVMTNAAASASNGSLKRKRDATEPEEEPSSKDSYFFAKFLTSPELLDLEIADTHFRRQFLFQLVIVLHHLLTFTKQAKDAWVSPRNRSLQMEFTLEPADAQWVTDTVAKAYDELRQTAPGGRVFADTVAMILEREKNWVRWKNDLCAPFDREPYAVESEDGASKVGLIEATRARRERMREDPPEWEHSLGSASLTEIWEMGYRSLRDLENPFQPGEVKDFVKKAKLEDNRIEMRRKTLTRQAERVAAARAKAAAAAVAPPAPPPAEPAADGPAPAPMAVDASPSRAAAPPPAGSPPLHPSLPARPGSTNTSPRPAPAAAQPHAAASIPAPIAEPVPAPAAVPAPAPVAAPSEASSVTTPAPPPPIVLPPDDQINKLEENKQRWAWLALRVAREQYLQHFSKIGTGDITLLAQEIEREKERAESPAVGAAKPSPSPLKRVLVTGGAGYIGSHIVYILQQTRRYKVVCIDNYHNSFPKALSRLEKIARDALPENATEQDRDSTAIDSHWADLTNRDQVHAVFAKYGKGGIWGVIHVAAYKAVGESTEIPLTYYHNNVSATVFLLQVMSSFDCTRFVYSSSATVYGTPPVVPIPETTRLEAQSPYGKSKVMSETVIEDLVHAEPKRWSAISLRYFNPAGAHPSGLIGEDPRGRPGNLLPILAQMAVGRLKDPELKVFGNDYPTPDGTCVRDYLHVLDLAAGHLLALDALEPASTVFGDAVRYKAYNLGRGQGYSVLQMVEAMRKATNFDYKYRIIERRSGDVPDLTADPALAERELGFKAVQTLDTMCKDLWNWQTKNPEGYGSD